MSDQYKPRRAKRTKAIKPKRKWTNKKPLLILGGIVLIAFFALGGFKLAEHFLTPLVASHQLPGGDANLLEGEEKLERGKPVNILVLGTDQRGNEPSRSDTIMVAALFPEEKQIKLLSVPRDSYASIPGHGKQRLNHAHAYGGAELTGKAVSTLLDIPLHYYVEVNFEGFINIIDILGGIEIDVEKKMYYPAEDIDLRAGLQTLNGKDALAYVRFRSDNQADIGRIARQQKFLTILAEEMKKTGTIFKMPSLIKEMVKHIDTDLPVNKLAYLAIKFKKLDDAHGFTTYTLDGYPDSKNGVSYWMLNEKKLKETIEEFQVPTREKAEAEEQTP